MAETLDRELWQDTSTPNTSVVYSLFSPRLSLFPLNFVFVFRLVQHDEESKFSSAEYIYNVTKSHSQTL
jgi:hypothetical protein